MYVIAFANPKGGTGKTTAALLLAEQLAKASGKVRVLDCDPNENLLAWQRDRHAAGRTGPFEVLARPKVKDVQQVAEYIDEIEAETDFLIVDLEGTAAQIVTVIFSRTDLAIIPFEPTPMETRQAARAVSLVKSTSRMLRRTIPFALLFTRTNAAFQTSDERDVRNETAGISAIPVSLVRRAAFTRIFRESLLLEELDPKQVSNLPAAIENARSYAQAVVNRLETEAA